MTVFRPLICSALCSTSNTFSGVSYRNLLRCIFAISDSRDSDAISLDSSDEDRVEQMLKGAVTSVDEALMKVTGAAENSQEDFLRKNFETLNQSCSTGMRSPTLIIHYF